MKSIACESISIYPNKQLTQGEGVVILDKDVGFLTKETPPVNFGHKKHGGVYKNNDPHWESYL